MPSSPLSLQRDALAASLDSLRWWLDVWTAVVVIGLAVEYFPTVVKFIRSRDRHLLTEIIGGIFITAGVAGELYVGFKSSPVEGRLRTIEQTQVASANERVLKMENENLQLRGELASLENGVADARTKQAAAEKALLELQLQRAPRTLTGEQQATLIEALKRSPGKLRISCPTGTNSTEACDFAKQLFTIFTAGSWEVPKVTNITYLGIETIGLMLFVRDPQNPPQRAKLVEELLSKVRMNPSWMPNKEAPSDDILLIVGSKPDTSPPAARR